ncbi:hydroxymyristoyl-ACP dehydratase [Porphyromonas gingivicanis]|uniref:Multifunctional fusion protein n=1 Tax=Porphyromonas gingivicanis TaxID=266762 RepID=A0A0A2G6L9_9PORP|nr:bifunctional UDP-3-O-[3-hydroxymyristoyl] N-acetylglucosamine deacetylase/3-hydroxyacyl-ACP dehydratase [Porphyromonas gingivicanis]KGN98030.1 hydroxymyristoyl-ACP dehydratase [Porphyromonas gingivicanis]
MQQQTLSAPLHFSGKGLHTGLDISMSLLPAPANTGYVVRRADKEGQTFSLLAELVNSTERSTVIKKGELSISTVEHVLSALYSLGVDNCIIEVNAPECPILDGSALPYIEAIQKVGLKEQEADREYYYVKQRMEVTDPETGAKLIALPDDQFSIDVHISYPSPALSNQFATYDANTDFASEIAPARSFVFVREILPLLEKGLIKGGDLSNAHVIYDEELDEDKKKALQTHLGEGYTIPEHLGSINPNPLMVNEPARHKLLDVIGDLALCGRFLKGHIIAFCPGHGINNQMARLIRKDIKQMEEQAPQYNPNLPPLLDINRIKELLPHRFPFLLVDKVIEIKRDSIVGVKSVSCNEPFFPGHFPEEPVMPGVLIVEAMAQTGGLLVLNSMGNEKCSTYFLKINNVKFRQKVVPGDTLLFKLRMTSEISRGVANMRGLAFVGNKLVCEAEFMAQIIKNNPQ